MIGLEKKYYFYFMNISASKIEFEVKLIEVLKFYFHHQMNEINLN